MIMQSELRREREKKVSTERNEYKSHSKEMDKAVFIGFLVHRKKDPGGEGKSTPPCARLLRIPSPSFTKQTQIRVIHITSFAFLPSNGTCDIRTDPGTRRRFLFFSSRMTPSFSSRSAVITQFARETRVKKTRAAPL